MREILPAVAERFHEGRSIELRIRKRAHFLYVPCEGFQPPRDGDVRVRAAPDKELDAVVHIRVVARRDHQPVSAALVAHGAHDHGRGHGAVIQQTSYPVRCQHFRHPPREGVRQKAIVKPDRNARFHAVQCHHVRKPLRDTLYVLLGEVLPDDPAEAPRSECDVICFHGHFSSKSPHVSGQKSAKTICNTVAVLLSKRRCSVFPSARTDTASSAG